MTVELANYEWLLSAAGEPALAIAADESRPLTSRADLLRKQFTATQTSLALETAMLRQRAAAKFSRAAQMFFTPLGLEQATDEVLARYKARRFADSSRVLDLCTGIGGDLVALSEGRAAGACQGLDRDPIMGLFAAHNRRVAAGTADVPTLLAGDACAADVAAWDAWHVDPDRRPGGRRTTHVEAHEPNEATLERLLAINPHAAIKLAPAAELSQAWEQRCELEWISRALECKQLVAWSGKLAEDAGRRRATVVNHDGTFRSILGRPGGEVPVAAEFGGYLFEPDAAVLAAKLDAVLAAEYGLSAIAPQTAYWTGDAPLADPLLACFEIEAELPFREPALKALLRQRNIGRLEIKKRGVDVDPQDLRKRLQLKGEETATLIIARRGKQVTALLTRRILRPKASSTSA